MTGHLFVMGLGRSGTTALTRVLAAHEDVVLGMERYKGLWSGPGQDVSALVPARFERAQLLDFDDGLTNLVPDVAPVWRDWYAEADRKLDGARYVGDKMTRILLSEVLEPLPDARFVVIVRDLARTAASWQTRADDPSDVWGAGGGAELAARRWVQAMRKLMRERHLTDHLVVVEYDDLFANPRTRAVDRVLEMLGLPDSPQVRSALERAQTTYREQLRDKPQPLAPEVVERLEALRPPTLWRRVRRTAQALPWQQRA